MERANGTGHKSSSGTERGSNTRQHSTRLSIQLIFDDGNGLRNLFSLPCRSIDLAVRKPSHIRIDSAFIR